MKHVTIDAGQPAWREIAYNDPILTARRLRHLPGFIFLDSAQHHDALVKRFIEQPAAKLSTGAHAGLTASGPPLPVLLRSLEVLRDMRMAAARTDMPSRNEDLGRLRRAVG